MNISSLRRQHEEIAKILDEIDRLVKNFSEKKRLNSL
jgi:Skp family chaperone for outer membrane proteins